MHAEWTKFRTVRGWVIAMVIAAALTAAVGLYAASGPQTGCQPVGPHGPIGPPAPCTPSNPVGPGGEAVSDSYYFVHQALRGNGSITVRVTSLTGRASPPGGGIAPGPNPEQNFTSAIQPWAKAGIIVTASTRQGSAYAAMMVTGRHGVRMQYNYTGDTPGLPGAVSAASPRWLRLVRTGDTLTGYDSADGTHWTRVGTVSLAGLPATVQAGPFVTSPAWVQAQNSGLTVATAVFDHVSFPGTAPGAGWHGASIGANAQVASSLPGRFHAAGGTFTVTGSGDIAPAGPGPTNIGEPADDGFAGAFAGLIVVIVVGAMFITAEYRRGLIRTTLAAAPARGRVLAAKAVVVGSVTFVAGVIGAAPVIPVGASLLRSHGNYVFPMSALTEVRLVAGIAALLAVTAVLALAAGTILRHAAGAITAVIALTVVIYFFSVPLAVLPAGRRGLAAAGHPGRRVRHPAVRPGLPAGEQRLHAAARLLPARAVGRVRRAVPVGRGRPVPGRRPAAAEGRMRAALHAEWTKLRTLPGTGWLLLGVVAATVIISATVSASVSCSSTAACHVDVTKLSLTGTYLGQAVVAIVAVLAVSGEYATGMIRTTLAAMPRRTTVLAAKAAVVTAVTLAAGTLAVLGSVLAGRLILPGHGYTPANGYPVLSLADGTVLRAAAGTVLYLALIALLSLGVAAAVRDAAVAIGAVLGLLYLFPILTQVAGSPAVARHLQQIGPMTAGLEIQASTGLRSLPIGPWAGLGVLAAWAAAALLAGTLLLRLRDA